MLSKGPARIIIYNPIFLSVLNLIYFLFDFSARFLPLRLVVTVPKISDHFFYFQNWYHFLFFCFIDASSASSASFSCCQFSVVLSCSSNCANFSSFCCNSSSIFLLSFSSSSSLGGSMAR